MAATFSELHRCVDAVAGAVALDPGDEAALTLQLRERGRREAAYAAILVEIDCLLDPIPHDPWPRHGTASGASFAVSLEAYRSIGGLPAIPLGEDRALARSLEAGGWRLRHGPNVHVVTSGRLIGRASGGAADTIRLRNEDPAAACDPRLEPLATAIRRARWRGRLRQIYEGTLSTPLDRVASALSLNPLLVAQALHATNFQQCWGRIETASPMLAIRALQPNELLEHILAGQAALLSLRARTLLREFGATRPGDNSPPALAAIPA
jgi:hypothetical protein